MDAQGKQNSQNNSEKEQRWSTHKSQFPNSPHTKSDRNQDTGVTGLRTDIEIDGTELRIQK